MNLDLIQNKLSELSTPKSGGQKNNDKALSFWKPTVGKALVRFVPSKNNPENPFTELYFHYGIGKRTIISPSNFGEKDPIIEWSLYQPFNIPWQLTGAEEKVYKTNRNIVELTIQKNNLYKFNEYLKFNYTKYYNQLGTTTSGSYINGVNQGYVLDNRDGRGNRVFNSQNDSGSVRRDSSITR